MAVVIFSLFDARRMAVCLHLHLERSVVDGVLVLAAGPFENCVPDVAFGREVAAAIRTRSLAWQNAAILEIRHVQSAQPAAEETAIPVLVAAVPAYFAYRVQSGVCDQLTKQSPEK